MPKTLSPAQIEAFIRDGFLFGFDAIPAEEARGLRAQPLLCTVSGVAPGVAAPGRKWLGLARAAEAAVPAPVRDLLGRLGAFASPVRR